MNGNIINGRYHIIQRLGGGGLGETYLAEDQWREGNNGNNRCVVKQLKPDVINPITLRLFEKEALVLCQLGSHDQIPQLIAHFQWQQQFYLVQEFVEGHDLSEEIKPGKPLSEAEIVNLLLDTLEVLKFVHEKNVIHRDIKPANIMRRKDGKLVLIDFGGVKLVKTNTGSTVLTPVVGTPGYLPVEQFNNNAQLSSDVYAVGMLAIQALTGLQPLQIPREPRTFQLLWRNKTRVDDRLADVLDKMVQFQYTERYESAGEALHAIKSFANTASDFLRRGDELFYLHRYEEALAACNQAIQMQVDYPEAWYSRGIVLRNMGRDEEAIASYDQAIEMRPDYAEAWYFRGYALHNLKHYELAIVSYDQAVKIQPNYLDAWLGRGYALRNLGRYEEAIASYEQGLQIKQDDPYAWFYYGGVLYDLTRYTEAISAYDKAIQYNPNYPAAWINRGYALRSLGKYEEAIASCEQAIKMRQDYPEAWLGKGAALNELGKYQEAIAAFDQAIEIKSDEPEAWYFRGMALVNQGKYEEAISAYKQALEIKPDYQLAIESRKRAEKSIRKSGFLGWLGL
jgi:tetratricopeptide (TPR) repeat protein